MTWIKILAVSFFLSLLALPYLIQFLRQQKLLIYVRQEVTEHAQKTGTPKAGGLLFLFVPFFACLLYRPSLEVWALLILFLGSGIIGFVDDWLSSRSKSSLGLKARYKILLQLIPALIFTFMTMKFSSIWIPFIPPLDIGWAYLPLSLIVIISSVNSVNLTDGADGLATSVFLTVLLALTIVTYLQGQFTLFPFICSLAGVLGGFLWYNTHPASVIMGDTGALALGAAMAGLSLILHIPLFLPFIAVIFVIETLSDILQIVYFRYTGGKRFFKRAPIHHHFQLSGWSETQIVVRFSLFNLFFIGLAFLFIWV